MGHQKGGPLEDMPAGLEESRAVFDRATRLARALFGSVDAQITLRTSQGLWRSRRTSAAGGEGAGVAEVMRQGELLWVEDCKADPRFQDDPVVTGPPFVRFFAGAPIRLEDGSTPGAILVAGLEPRPFDRGLGLRLQDLADFVADEWTRVRARKARDAYERTMVSIVKALPVSMVMTDRDMRVLYASPVWIKARELEDQQVVGRTLFELRPDIFEQWRDGVAATLASDGIAVDRVEMPRSDGTIEYVRAELTPWRDHKGEVAGLIIASSDVTALVEALDRTERSEERLRLALELADLHVYEMDYARKELSKAGAEDSFFEEPKTYEELDADIFGTIDPRDQRMVMEAWKNRGENGYKPEYRIKRADGREVWASGAARLISDETGRPLRLIGALQNITQRKMAEQALLQAKEDAEAATKAKSAFLATMSHEIRTPLNGVLGMAQAMAVDGLPPVQAERLEVIRQSAESLLTILNDVLDLSKIEAGKLELERSRFDLDELARTVHATFSALADAKGLAFELLVDKAASGAYEGDPVRVRQILWNLVGNALKFTSRGSVKVRASRRNGLLRLAVADTGIGISPEQAKGLFRKFEQADASTTRRFGGTGLGLAICRELTELMGGKIRVESQAGRGATFTVELPLTRAAARKAKPRRAPARTRGPRGLAASRPVRLLAAEDNAMNQLVLKTLLGQVGIDPFLVADGAEAVAAWEREPWDVILMDVQMPVMDGPTATQIIRTREREAKRARTPIVALTANAMSHQVAEYLAGGMDAVVPKPIEAARLYEALQAVVTHDEDERPDAAAA